MLKEADHFHAKTPEEALKQLNSSPSGLTEKEAKLRKYKYGSNEILEKKTLSPVIVFLRQFKSLMVYILLAAAIISFLLDRIVDTYVILVILIINSIVGFTQEYKAEKAIKSLKKMIVLQTKVLRNSELMQIPSKNLVPGDIVILEEGDRVPSDCRLIEIKNFRTVESSLTGESLPVDKFLKVLPSKTSLSDRKNMVWLGTFVVAGHAKALVVSTGESTAIGRLGKSIESIKARRSHFQEKTDVLAKYMAIVAFAGALLVFLIGYFIRDIPLSEISLFSLASLVSGIPEGLPVILAMVLAIGAYRMAKKNAVVRERFATETLGVVDTIITDKTGTLTENTMTVQEIILPGQNNIEVTGHGWEPEGNFIQNKKQLLPLQNKHLVKLLHIAAVCNNSKLFKDKEENKYKIIGDPTEAALLVLAEKAGFKRQLLLEKEKQIDELPFSPELKYRASLSVLTQRNSTKEIYIIGAPEAVIQHSTQILKNGRKTKLTEQDKKILENKIDALAHKAMRVLAIAYKEVPSSLNELTEKETTKLVFVGVIGMIDPPREEVIDAISKTKKAGIRVLMATGDHKNTALAIAKKIGLIEHKEGKVLTGSDLESLTQKEFEKALKEVSVFARLTPQMKLRIAKTLQEQGHIIAMTGDGVNDAPALKQADIGVSMGIIGTDVARESSQIVLADDNFASIVNAIEEGRIVFTNTKQTSFFLVATSIAESTTIISTMLIGLPLPLLPTQILWLNLVTAGVTDVALSTEQNHHDVLNEKPRDRNENILNKEIIPFAILISLVMVILTLILFIYHLPDLSKARTAAFTAMSFTQLFNMLSFRSLRRTSFSIGLFSNKYINWAFIISALLAFIAIYLPMLQGVFNFTPLSFQEIVLIFILSSSAFWTSEIYKKVRKTAL